MELHEYLGILRRYWRSALAVALVTIAGAAGLALSQPSVYSAASSLYLAVEAGDSAGELSQGASYAERQVKSFVAVATSAAVLQPAIDQLGLDVSPAELAGSVSVTSPVSTSILRISAQHEDPALAADIANAVSQSLAQTVDALAPAAGDGRRLVSATVIDPAVQPTQRVSPRPAMNLALGTLIGILLGVGQAILRGLLDTRIRTVEDLEAESEMPLLGVIGHQQAHLADRSEGSKEQWATAEAYRRLRTNVGFLTLGGERRPSMVISSSLSGEGKTQTAVNLARVLAQAGESVLLVDADLRRPAVAARMGLDSEVGLSDVLTGRGVLSELLINVGPNLSVLAAGTIPPNPSELLGSDAMSHLVSSVERDFDHVIFDAPPILPVTDAVVLGAQTSGVILVARSGIVKKAELGRTRQLLETGQVGLLGVVLNGVPQNRNSAYGGYYLKGKDAARQQPVVSRSESSR